MHIFKALQTFPTAMILHTISSYFEGNDPFKGIEPFESCITEGITLRLLRAMSCLRALSLLRAFNLPVSRETAILGVLFAE